MKKTLNTMLALLLMLNLGITAFAADNLGGSQDVTAKYVKSESEETIYNVDLNWGDLTFTYTENVQKVWDPDSHTYGTTVTGGSWDNDEAEITVTNHSNVAVEVSMSMTFVENTGVDVTLDGGNANLAAGVENDVDGAASVTGTVKVSGKPDSNIDANGIKVASITVTIQ